MDSKTIDIIAEAIWAMPSAKRITSWDEMPEKIKDLWREDAKRVVQALNANYIELRS